MQKHKRLTKTRVRRACEALAAELGHDLGGWGSWFCDPRVLASCKQCGYWVGFHLNDVSDEDAELVDGLKPGGCKPDFLQGTLLDNWVIGSYIVTKTRCIALPQLRAAKARRIQLRSLATKCAGRVAVPAHAETMADFLFRALRAKVLTAKEVAEAGAMK